MLRPRASHLQHERALPFIQAPVAGELYPYLATVCQTSGCPALQVGGTEDHIHVLFALSRTMTIAGLAQEVKTDSSKWIKTKGQDYRHFAWQNGYGAFSIGQSQVETLRRYIVNQSKHHAVRSYQDEFRILCRRYNVAFDERYVWD